MILQNVPNKVSVPMYLSRYVGFNLLINTGD